MGADKIYPLQKSAIKCYTTAKYCMWHKYIDNYKSVFRIRDIKKKFLVRIRILGSVPMIDGSDSGSCSFFSDFQATRHQQKNNFFLQCCGSVMFISYPGCLSRIPDPTFFHPGSELSPSRNRIKEFEYFNPKKWFLSSRKYDLGCSSRIRMLTFYPSRIPGSKRSTLYNFTNTQWTKQTYAYCRSIYQKHSTIYILAQL